MDESVSRDGPDGAVPAGGDAAAGRRAPVLVPAVSRALAVLDLLADGREPMNVARIAARLGLPKSSTHGLCHTLAVRGYLRRCIDGSYFLGPRVMSLGQAFIARTDVTQEFGAALEQELAAPPDETLVLSVLDGTDVVYLAARQGRRPLGLAFSAGMRLPAHLAATGRAMLAYQDEAQLRRLLPREELARLTQHGPATRVQLLQELDAVRARGYSIDDETVREGVYCLGAPVFDASGRAVAGVGVCIHKASLATDGQGGGAERQRDTVLRVARRLTQRLGGSEPGITTIGGAAA
ncbi:IclR family transcriptional regulator [Caldimonas tepidiphila]|uniref:IclR family transcriptional regulator n=1 Tax=Caldimonas tepidiphila TaxID=2315841 RepID=UPI000E5B54AA|nr:IclR family transcriptional regulator [Caldimonas tepidiphila]